MFRRLHGMVGKRWRFPRVCGDVPAFLAHLGAGAEVFPAYAGMFRLGEANRRLACRFPRVCGDVPIGSDTIQRFS